MSDPAAAPVALISTEVELPVVSIVDGSPPLPQVFDALWADLARCGWTTGDFCITRDHPCEGQAISSHQMMSTDTGPVIELVVSPSTTLAGIAAQLASLQSEARDALERVGCARRRGGCIDIGPGGPGVG